MTNPFEDRWPAELAAYREAVEHARVFGPGTRGGYFQRESPIRRAVIKAQRAIREWRRVSNTRGADYEIEEASIGITAHMLASQILAAASDNQDRATIAWVVAGLRCPRMFCEGCDTCQTITSPTRPTS